MTLPAFRAAHKKRPRQDDRPAGVPDVMPEFRRLRAFVVLSEELSFCRAAARLSMAQSPLSRVIKSLEDDLGVRLFERTNRRVRLTEAGLTFRTEVDRLLSVAHAAIERTRRVER